MWKEDLNKFINTVTYFVKYQSRILIYDICKQNMCDFIVVKHEFFVKQLLPFAANPQTVWSTLS
jgi:hypothetical protein